MKIFKLISFLILVLTQVYFGQDKVETPKDNSMSDVIGVTVEGGVTLGYTDYNKNRMNYTGKGSLEYYLPSSGKGNIGIRIFGQKGNVAGENPPAGSGNPTTQLVTKFDMLGGGIFYILSIDDAVYPWVAIGGSNIWFYPEDGNKKDLPNYAAGNYKDYMLAYNGDAGVRIMASKNLSVNINVGLVIGSKDYLDDIKNGTDNDVFYTATAGLSYYFGRETDSDRDGVPNSGDACPDTPIKVKVDEFGCPVDTDKDGVPDYLDRCENTPAKVKVDQDGCPLDFDRDGVPDYLDKCSNTPAGVQVDQNGCALDSDKDGVSDDIDKCPNTPAGVKVDKTGCTLDSDGDGVADNKDQCPNTPAGVQVNSDGCPIKIEVPAEIESLVLSGDTNFESNKSKLLPNAYAALENIVSTMKKHPEYKWEIGGHTDGVGSDAYNTKLSKQRAQSVVDYLISKGISRNSLKIVGYGEDKPIATNDTNEGRSMNRRVEIKLLSKK